MEASLVGSGFGAVLGGMLAGAVTDLAGQPIHTMAAYAIGGVLGAVVGLLAGRVAASVLL